MSEPTTDTAERIRIRQDNDYRWWFEVLDYCGEIAVRGHRDTYHDALTAARGWLS